jgi:hypothetical protein
MLPRWPFPIKTAVTALVLPHRSLRHRGRPRFDLGLVRLEDRTLRSVMGGLGQDLTHAQDVPLVISSPAGPLTLLAVADLTGKGTKDLIYASQELDHVVVDDNGGRTTTTPTTATPGLLDPGAVTEADLNGDGIPDLIIANSAGNNLEVYIGQGNGQFESALNDGSGFLAGTSPVGITVADVNGDGRPDLEVTSSGSNLVSVLLNQPQGNCITFTPGPADPLALALAVSPSVPVVTPDTPGSSNTPDPLAPAVSSPVPVVTPDTPDSPVTSDPFPESPPAPVVTPEAPGPNDSTSSSNFTVASTVPSALSPGEVESGPAATAPLVSPSQGFETPVVARNDDAILALLDDGAEVPLVSPGSSGLPNPAPLAPWLFPGDPVEFDPASAGLEAPTLLTFLLGGEMAPRDSLTAPGVTIQDVQLLPLRDSSLPLITSLLTLTIKPAQSRSDPDMGLTDPEAADAVSFLPETPVTVTVGQGLTVFASSGAAESGDAGASNTPVDLNLAGAEKSTSSLPFLMGIDDALDRFRQEPLDQFVNRDRPPTDRTQARHAPSEPWNPSHGEQALQGQVGTDSNFAPGTNQGRVLYETITEFPPTPASLPSATRRSTEPVERREEPLLSSDERGLKSLTELAGLLSISVVVAGRIAAPGMRRGTRPKLKDL